MLRKERVMLRVASNQKKLGAIELYDAKSKQMHFT